ncbi:purine-cytosine permease family protein [Nakamurella endophytica]|uniref:Cytosine permease n=1 Tax=Nakamurella endophytica TaxID=1748367 RepID=A0A917SXE2_9ACTN|nr:cytosine permease [Nakamurella endophytica]GGM02660.1 cytosine permease [Nakamurella endophytica]
MSSAPVDVAGDRHYGARVAAVEPGGAEVIPLSERHGRPVQMLWTWISPNMEFSTIYVGALGLIFGLGFWQTFWAVVIGSALGSTTQAVLSSWGPDTGYCQMVLSRRAFGYRGNILPAGLNWLVAGVGWFAVNSVSGAFALSALTGLDLYLALAVVVVLMLLLAFFGHNLIHVFERFAAPVLTVIFLAGGVVILSKAHLGAPAAGAFPGAWWVLLGATFGYAAGWNPYGADYTRYLPPGTGRPAGIFAGLGVLVSCVLLESFGAAAFSVLGGGSYTGNPTLGYTSVLPDWLGKLTLLGIALGAVAANALNVYSSAISFAAMGFTVRLHWLRAAIAVVMGIAGFVVASFGLHNIASYESFLLVIAYWVGPWLAVVFADRLLRRFRPGETVYSDTGYRNWAGFVAMLVSAVLSIWLFSNQTFYRGPVAARLAQIGDLTFQVGFVLAFVLYLVLYRRLADPIRVTAPEPGTARSTGAR